MIKRITSLILIIIIAVAGTFAWWMYVQRNTVKIYFATKDGMNLKIEHRSVQGDRVRSAIEALIKGPESAGLSPTIPEDVQLLSYKITGGVCSVNFNEKLAKNHWGGSSGELLTIYSIVNTLAQFPGVEKVQILIEGRKVETLAGHLTLDESLTPDEELVK